MNNEIRWEAAREREMDEYFESFFEDDDFIFRCLYCNESSPIKDMADVDPDKEEGICKVCEDNEAFAADWGLT